MKNVRSINSCGHKVLSNVKDVRHSFVSDQRNNPMCSAWKVNQELTKTKGNLPAHVTCVVSRKFDTKKSHFKIVLKRQYEWRVGFNSWEKTSSIKQLSSGHSNNMKFRALFETWDGSFAHIGKSFITAQAGLMLATAYMF